MKTQLKFIAVAVLAAVAVPAAMAQSAGTFMTRFGISTISPQVTSGDLSAPSLPNSKTDVGSANQLSGGLTYMYSDNIAIDLPLALPFKHKIYGAGSLSGLGEIGEVRALPITLSAQYRFMEPSAQFRPYIGLGVTYAYFFNATGSAALTATTNPGGPPTKISIDPKFTLTPLIGATFAIDKKWFLDAYYSSSKLSTTTHLSTGQSVEVALDPVSYGLAVGYKF